jgi:hypothetical protein
MRAASALLFLLGAMAIAAPGAASRSGRQTLVVVVSGAGRVVSSPAGIACSRTCSARFASGTRVRLTPRARKGAHFVRWGGACSGRAACAVRLSAARLVTARFAGGAVRTRPKQTAAGRPVAEPGSYSGANPQNGYGFTFFVSTTGLRIENVSIPYVKVACTPAATGAPALDHLGILTGTVTRKGSFAAKGSQKGVFGGFPATFTYRFSGRLSPAGAAGRATAAGSFREDIVYTDTATHHCTSNDQSWTASKTGPVPQRASLVSSGSYSGANPQNGYGFTFSVSPGGRSLVNVSIPYVKIACVPPLSGAPSLDHLGIARGTVRADGSFTATGSQSGVFAGLPARFTYSFTGSFQGLNTAGRATAAGSFREDIAFADGGGTRHTCTSNDQFWSATRAS